MSDVTAATEVRLRPEAATADRAVPAWAESALERDEERCALVGVARVVDPHGLATFEGVDLVSLAMLIAGGFMEASTRFAEGHPRVHELLSLLGHCPELRLSGTAFHGSRFASLRFESVWLDTAGLDSPRRFRCDVAMQAIGIPLGRRVTWEGAIRRLRWAGNLDSAATHL